MSGYRLPAGGRIDRTRRLTFSFDGVDHSGFAGDTLASALLAAGVSVVARSPYRDRPRGIFSAGREEPNAIVAVGPADRADFLRATEVELVDGLEARSRRGKAPAPAIDDRRYEHVHRHCEVLVIGGGPAGLAAARVAASTGARVVLVDDQAELGGSLLASNRMIEGRPGLEWVAAVRDELAARPEVAILTRATAVGRYDANLVLVAERITDHLPLDRRAAGPSQRLWHIRARQIVLATGAMERPLVFRDNDRPGILLAGAVGTYLARFGVAAGRRAVVFTTNDAAYPVALDLVAAGVSVAAIVDARAGGSAWTARATAAGIDCLTGAAVIGTSGDEALASVTIAPRDAIGTDGTVGVGATRTIECDLLAVSGGWNPALQLFSFPGGQLAWDERLAAFVPGNVVDGVLVAGAATGAVGLRAALAGGAATGAAAVTAAGFEPAAPLPTPAAEADDEPDGPTEPLWFVPGPGDVTLGDHHFVDLGRDATLADITTAVEDGMRYPEHIKRYTTIGTGSDQGRTSTVNAAGIIATLTGQSISTMSPSAFRPPAVPVAFGLLAGSHRGELFDPVRPTPIHASHAALGAEFENVGQWKRAWVYRRPGESFDDAVLRECRAVREGVGIMDVSTLGKIDIQGPDAGIFLDRVYTNQFSTLKVGSSRYGLMCRLDGMAYDDGTTTRLADDRYYMTTTTSNAASVMEWLEEWLQTEWPELRVRCTSVTDQWAAVAIVGPKARELLGSLAPDLDLDPAAFPWMTARSAEVAGMPARIFRISFSGELAYEVNVRAWSGRALWDAIATVRSDLMVTPYGTEAMHVLRAEKGYVILGQDSDGTVNPFDLGLGWMVSKKKWFIGRRSLERPGMLSPDRRQLVGLLPADPAEHVPEGSALILPADGAAGSAAGANGRMRTAGHVTSSYVSSALGRTFAMGLLAGGRSRIGTTVQAELLDGRRVSMAVTEPIFYDPENTRRDG